MAGDDDTLGLGVDGCLYGRTGDDTVDGGSGRDRVKWCLNAEQRSRCR
jgi:Ca2+-binding RTX toxin-like protein